MEEESEDVPEEVLSWRSKLHHILTKKITPDAFERLTKRLLRESGFVQVEVTGRSRDGGVDGKGIIRIGGLLSFHVVFQCKKYQGSVGASHCATSVEQWWVALTKDYSSLPAILREML